MLSSTSGKVIPSWPQTAAAPITGEGGPATADLSGLGYQDVIVPTILGVDVFDGKSGKLPTVLVQDVVGTQSTPLVTQDSPGVVGITIAYYQGTNTGCPGLGPCLQGVITHYTVRVPARARVGPSDQSWPKFHHDLHLTGNLETNLTNP